MSDYRAKGRGIVQFTGHRRKMAATGAALCLHRLSSCNRHKLMAIGANVAAFSLMRVNETYFEILLDLCMIRRGV
jgi:hypothetical protein